MNTLFGIAVGGAAVMIVLIAVLLALTVLEEVERYSRKFPRMRRTRR